jgi:hypothetical protein
MITNDQYWAAQDPKVQALRDIPSTPGGSYDLASRETLAKELNDQGFVIDRGIMIDGWDAGRTMEIRALYGYKSFPNAFSATPTIKVSTDEKDYPPFVPLPVFTSSNSPIGAQNGDQFSVPGMFGPVYFWTIKS